MQDQLGCTPASTLTRHPRHRQWKCTSSMSRLWNRNCTSISNWECESLESPHLNSPYSNVVTAGQPMLNHFQLAWQMCSLLESDAPAAVPATHCPIAEHLHQFARSKKPIETRLAVRGVILRRTIRTRCCPRSACTTCGLNIAHPRQVWGHTQYSL